MADKRYALNTLPRLSPDRKWRGSNASRTYTEKLLGMRDRPTLGYPHDATATAFTSRRCYVSIAKLRRGDVHGE